MLNARDQPCGGHYNPREGPEEDIFSYELTSGLSKGAKSQVAVNKGSFCPVINCLPFHIQYVSGPGAGFHRTIVVPDKVAGKHPTRNSFVNCRISPSCTAFLECIQVYFPSLNEGASEAAGGNYFSILQVGILVFVIRYKCDLVPPGAEGL